MSENVHFYIDINIMSNYIINHLELPLNILNNIVVHPKTSIDNCDIILITADTFRKERYVCDKCGSYHRHFVKEYKYIFNKYTVFDNCLVILKINKRRLSCYECHSTFTEELPFINKHARISKKLIKLISNDFIITKTNKDIALRHFVSESTISRLSYKMEEYIDNVNYNYLPKAIGFDELKATKDSQDSMAFIMISHDSKMPIDILPSRRTLFLNKYFSSFSQDALDNVEIITMDMYSLYITIAQKFFKNATIVFDKFHVVQNFTRALNFTRINAMKDFNTTVIKYKRLKKYWKAILSLKIEVSLDYYKLPLFENKTNISNVVDSITNYNTTLRHTYTFYQLFFHHLNNKDFTAAKSLIDYYYYLVSDKMRTAMNTFKKYFDYSCNAYKTNYSNALTESIVGKIKLIKRNAYGYKNFLALKRRLLHYFKTRYLRDQLLKLPKIKNIRKFAATS